VYVDMSGRVAIVLGRPSFDVLPVRLCSRLPLVPLNAATLMNVMTIVILRVQWGRDTGGSRRHGQSGGTT
jgi:hypothetical protein